MEMQINVNTKIIYMDSAVPVMRAIENVKRDIRKVCCDSDEKGCDIVLIMENMQAEQFEIKCDNNMLVIYASDTLGFVYGLYHISRDILGVLPFWFWNDQVFIKKKGCRISGEYAYTSKPYAVKYRGWFVNDEVLIHKWYVDRKKDMPWEMVFEALLRCGGNLVIPGTDKNSHIYRDLAADMGLRITHHHAEPLGAPMFARRYPELTPSYDEYPEKFHELWKEGIDEQKKLDVIWNLGFRGQGDCPFWDNDPRYQTSESRGELMGKLIGLQRDYTEFIIGLQTKQRRRKPMRKRTNKLLAVLLTGAMAMSMGACGNGGASTDNTQKKGSDDQVTIKITWWGGDARHEATQKVLDLYTESHPNVKFEAIPAGWDGYFEKLSTQAASGSMPDIVQMDYLYISTYAKNNSLADLSEYVDSGVIDTSTIDKNIMKTGDSNGKTVGIPLSTTALAVTYNPTVIEQAGAEVPSDDWTWDDYITLNEKVAKSTGKPSALAATAGIFGDVNIFNYWVRSQGESLFNEDGTALGYDDDKITSDFFDMWKKMADDNVAPDADEQTQIASLGKEGLPIVTDEAATDIEWNAFPTTVSSANPNLKLAVMPNAKDSGLWLKPGMFFSVSETSKVKEECAKFINWFVNSNEANEILLGERGTPVSSDVRDNLIERDKLSEQQKEAFEYTDKVSAVVGETPAADPSGIAEVNEAFASAGNSVLYGQLTSKEAAKQFREKANAILERNNAQ